jgi:hypothetical protein
MRVQVAALVLATALSTLPPVFAHAASPVSFGVELGVVSRDIEEEGALLVGTGTGIADSTQLTARLGVQVAPPVLLFGEFGVADITIDEFDQYRSDMHPLYGGGARLVLFEGAYPETLSVYSDVRVVRLKTDDQVIACIASCGSPTPVEALVDEEISWTEYGVGLGVRGRYEGFRPFGGFRVSRLDGTDRVGAVTADIREREMVGFFFGVDILLDRDERAAITVQLSGIDENALRVGYKVAF